MRRLAAGRFVSFAGTGIAFTALMYTVYDRTGSSLWLSAAMLAFFGAVAVCGPVAGLLADRFDRRRVMIASDLAAAAVFAALAPADAPWLLVALGFLGAAAETPFLVASAAALPNLVAAERLAAANGLLALARNAGFLAGPLVAGVVLAAAGSSAAFALNAATYLVSAAIVWSIRGRFAGDRADADEHRGARAGLVYAWRDPVLRAILTAWLVLCAGIGVVMVAEVPLAASFGVGAMGYALVIAFWSAGGIAGALWARRLAARQEPAALTGGLVAMALGLGLCAVTPVFVPVLAGMLVGGVGEGLTSVAEQGILQRRAPDAVRSRVFAASEGLANLALALSFAGAGFLVEAVGAQAVYAIGAVSCGFGVPVLLRAFAAEGYEVRRSYIPSRSRVKRSRE